MNEFYYSAEPTSAHAEREIEIEALGVRSRWTARRFRRKPRSI